MLSIQLLSHLDPMAGPLEGHFLRVTEVCWTDMNHIGGRNV